MAGSLNRVQVIGNLTRDPEVRKTPNGATVATIGVATNRKWKDANGQLQEEVEYHNVVVWNKLAEICQQYLRKGRKVYFEGRLKTRSWEDPDGKKNYRTEIIAENMIMLDSKEGGGYTPAGDNPVKSAPVEQPSAPTPVEEEEVKIDDLPF